MVCVFVVNLSVCYRAWKDILSLFLAVVLGGCKEQAADTVERCWHEARDSAWELLVAKAKAEDSRQFNVVYEEINLAHIASYNACLARAKS